MASASAPYAQGKTPENISAQFGRWFVFVVGPALHVFVMFALKLIRRQPTDRETKFESEADVNFVDH